MSPDRITTILLQSKSFVLNNELFVNMLFFESRIIMRSKLWPFEQYCLEQLVAGRDVDFLTSGLPELEDVDDDRDIFEGLPVLRASFIRELCVQEDMHFTIPSRGVWIWGAAIIGELNLEGTNLELPIWLEWCVFTDAIILRTARTRTISFTASEMRGILDARGVSVDGFVFLRGSGVHPYEKQFQNPFISRRGVLLRDAEVSLALDCTGSIFEIDISSIGQKSIEEIEARSDCFTIRRAKIRMLDWGRFPKRPEGVVDFQDAEVVTFRDGIASDRNLKSWPRKQKLKLDGFSYEKKDYAPVAKHIKWLNLQDRFSPQSYQTLSRVLSDMGYRYDAQEISVRRRVRQIPHLRNPLLILAELFLFLTARFGYSTFRILVTILASIWVASFYFDAKFKDEQILPEKEFVVLDRCYKTWSDDCKIRDWSAVKYRGQVLDINGPRSYPEFDPILHSADTLLPLFNFGMREHWGPPDKQLRLHEFLLILYGLSLNGIFVGSVTGLLQKDR